MKRIKDKLTPRWVRGASQALQRNVPQSGLGHVWVKIGSRLAQDWLITHTLSITPGGGNTSNQLNLPHE
jgi:hypothetical protein